MDKNNAVVMWGGTKNGGKMKLRKAFSSNNITVMIIPHRYDLQINSCVNNYLKVFNRKLREHWKVF